MIRAEVHTDDYGAEARFDATAFFEQADDDALDALVLCGYRGDYPADAVAEFAAADNPEVAEVFAYLENARWMRRAAGFDGIGFECSVDPEDAEAWIKAHRPAVLAR
jgi:hypothetical protein